ncbi:MAG: type II secretion system F family protein [Phycisphaerae bacterium]|nr:type II secretion system F family protein [Phycisphaerae bacterium]
MLLIIILSGFIVLAIYQPLLAMVLSPIISATLAGISAEQGEEGMAFLFSSIFLAVLLTVSLRTPKHDQPFWPQTLARWILGTILFFGLAISSFVVMPFLAVYGLLFWIAMAAVIIRYHVIAQDNLALEIFSLLGSCMRQNLPLATALESAAAGRHDKRSVILIRISQWLTFGFSLSDAIRRGYPRCPGNALGIIEMAERANQLPLAIKTIENDMFEKANDARRFKTFNPIYIIILLSVMLTIVMGVMVFIVPKFEAIFADLGAKLPPATQFLMKIAQAGYIWMLPLFLFINGIIIPLCIYTRFRPRRANSPRMLSKFGDMLKWNLPILKWFEKNNALAQVTSMLRLSLSAGCTVNNAIFNTTGLDVNIYFKKRLHRWLKQVERGDDVVLSAKKNDLGRPIAWAMDSHVHQENVPRALGSLEEFYRANNNYFVNIARQILWPILIIFMGAIVGFIVYAFFTPMVSLLEHLMADMMP